MKKLLCAAALLVAAACAHRTEASRFEALDASRFNFNATADAAYPVDSPSSEEIRMDWLKTYLDNNGMCARGYVIDERHTTVQTKGLLGDVVDIRYRGHCV